MGGCAFVGMGVRGGAVERGAVAPDDDPGGAPCRIRSWRWALESSGTLGPQHDVSQ